MVKSVNLSDSNEPDILVGKKNVVMYHKILIIPAITKPFKNLGAFSSLFKKLLPTTKEPLRMIDKIVEIIKVKL